MKYAVIERELATGCEVVVKVVEGYDDAKKTLVELTGIPNIPGNDMEVSVKTPGGELVSLKYYIEHFSINN